MLTESGSVPGHDPVIDAVLFISIPGVNAISIVQESLSVTVPPE